MAEATALQGDIFFGKWFVKNGFSNAVTQQSRLLGTPMKQLDIYRMDYLR